MTTERQLSDFLGQWSLRRLITPTQGPPARFVGEAVWSEVDGARAAYKEIGTLQIEGQAPLHSARGYIWDDSLTVWFEDGRFFHQIPPAGGQAEHWCDPDRYLATYRFDRWPRFEISWRVKGPRKDYLSVSSYEPVRT